MIDEDIIGHGTNKGSLTKAIVNRVEIDNMKTREETINFIHERHSQNNSLGIEG